MATELSRQKPCETERCRRGAGEVPERCQRGARGGCDAEARSREMRDTAPPDVRVYIVELSQYILKRVLIAP